MAQQMENLGEIQAFDLSKKKIDLIEKMCQRLGIKMVKTIKADATRALPISQGLVFDRVLADVPCSGFGTLRRNPDLKWRRGEKDVKRLSDVQSSILRNLSGYVKEGGILVYSTCTVFREENEDVVEGFLEGHPEFHLDRVSKILPEKCHNLDKNGYFKTFPPKDEMDGFFVARMIKDNRQ